MAPSIDTYLKGKLVMYRWQQPAGWFTGQVSRIYTPPKGRHQYNVEINYPDGRYDQRLKAEHYTAEPGGDSVPGSWCVLVKDP